LEQNSRLYIHVMKAAAPGDRRFWAEIVVATLVILLLAAAQLVSGQLARAATGAASLTGVVTASDTQAPIEGVEVALYVSINEAQTELVASATTGGDGSYLAEGLEATTYVVTFTPPSADYVETTVSFFSVQEGTNTLDQILERSATVSGTVMAENSEGTAEVLPGTRVNVSRVGGSYFSQGATVDEEGNYTITGIPSGTYEVQFNPLQEISTHLTSYLGGALDPEDAEPLTLASGETRTSIDATLILGSTISGTVTGSDGVTQTGASAAIFREDADGAWVGEQALQGAPDDNGDYTVVGLRPGTYRVGFLNRFEGSGQYQPEYFDNETTLEAATTVELGLHENISGINAVLEPANGQPASPAPPAFSAPSSPAPQLSSEERAETGSASRLLPFGAALVVIGVSLLITHRTTSRTAASSSGNLTRIR
jgi:Carboxypeptidase regulatory-like domain